MWRLTDEEEVEDPDGELDRDLVEADADEVLSEGESQALGRAE